MNWRYAPTLILAFSMLLEAQSAGVPDTEVRLLAPGSAEAELAFRDIAGRHLERSFRVLAPLTAVIENLSAKAIVGQSLTWTFYHADGTESGLLQNYFSPDRLKDGPAARKFEYPAGDTQPGAAQAFSWFANFHKSTMAFWTDEGLAQEASEHLADLRPIQPVAVRLNAVIFDDGEVVGEDTTGLLDAFSAWLNARRDLLAEILAHPEVSLGERLERAGPAEIAFGDLYAEYKDSFRRELIRNLRAMGEQYAMKRALAAQRQNPLKLRRRALNPEE
jgi:hypothetical protein